jgi:hypothetical protein
MKMSDGAELGGPKRKQQLLHSKSALLTCRAPTHTRSIFSSLTYYSTQCDSSGFNWATPSFTTLGSVVIFTASS